MMRMRLLQAVDGVDADGIPLAEGGSTIGRATDCDLVLNDPMRLVSRRHAWLLPQAPDRALLRCVSTTSGVAVNDEPLPPGAERVVQAGDRLRIGVFEIVLDGDDAGVDFTAGIGTALPDPASFAPAAPARAMAAVPEAVPEPARGAAPGPRVPDPRAAPAEPPRVPAPPPQWWEPAPAPPPFSRSRLDAFYDLDNAPDPMAPGSPLAPGATASAPRPPRSVSPPPVPVPTRSPLPAPMAPTSRSHAPPSPPAVAATSDPLPHAPPAADRAAAARAPRPPAPPPDAVTLIAAPPARPMPPPIAPIAAPPPAPNAGESALWHAFVVGAGLDPARAPPADPARLAQVGRLLREVADGTLALLQDRLVDRFDQRAGGTQFVSGRRNPLDFAHDADEVMRLLLSTEPWPGLLDPVHALHHAYRGLRVEQQALVPAMHEALRALLDALDAESPDGADGAPRGLAAHLPVARDAQRWRRHVAARQALREDLEQAFAAAFGPALRKALAEPSPPDSDPRSRR